MTPMGHRSRSAARRRCWRRSRRCGASWSVAPPRCRSVAALARGERLRERAERVTSACWKPGEMMEEFEEAMTHVGVGKLSALVARQRRAPDRANAGGGPGAPQREHHPTVAERARPRLRPWPAVSFPQPWRSPTAPRTSIQPWRDPDGAQITQQQGGAGDARARRGASWRASRRRSCTIGSQR